MTHSKLEKLKQTLSDMQSILIAYSGGVDSTFLVKAAVDTLGPEKVLAVTATSDTYPVEEWEYATKLIKSLGSRHKSIQTDELHNDKFVQNPPDRCYHCKTELFQKLKGLAEENHLAFVADGANADDLQDFRPGMKAGKALGVRSPLQEAGLTKEEIRKTAKELGLPNWDKPSMPCLSSRFPYGHAISKDKLRQVEEAEKFLRNLGFPELRVRHHGDIARIEVPRQNIDRIAAEPLRSQITNRLKALGFTYITLDLCGFRSGSMNEVLSKEIING